MTLGELKRDYGSNWVEASRIQGELYLPTHPIKS
jgi:hypothetical protein